MPRKPLIRSSTHYYHISNRTNHKLPFPVALKELWPIFLGCLQEAKATHPFDLRSFVLMNNHYHLLLRTPDANIDKIMHHLNWKFSLKVGERAQAIGRLFGGRYKWSLIKDEAYFFNVYRYIYQNPLRAQLVKRVEDYPYSSLSPSTKSYALYDGEVDADWLALFNVRLEPLKEQSISKGLKKSTFKPFKARK